MRFLGLEIRRTKFIPVAARGGWRRILEPFTGAWQQNVDLTVGDMTAHSAVFASLATLAGDVSKLRLKVMAQRPDGGWSETRDANAELLAKPNHFQTRAQFIESWMHSRLLYGNTFALLRRNQRGKVVSIYVLDPTRVQPMVSDSGNVFYKLSVDNLNGVHANSDLNLTMPASEVIHDRVNTFFHPLVGISPITAAGWAARVGIKIQSNAAAFFANGAAPSGILTAPAGLSEPDALSLKNEWASGFTGENAGRIAVVGADLRYQQLSISATDSQLIEQLRFSAEDVARAFRIPPHMIGAAAPPAYANVEALTSAYYSQALQPILEQIEGALDAGLGFPATLKTEFDIAALLRMDTATRYSANSAAVSGGWMSPNEARATANLPPVAGGDSPFLQQQNWSLAQLASRHSPSDSTVDRHIPRHRSSASLKRSDICKQMLASGYSDEQAARAANLPAGWTAAQFLATSQSGETSHG